MIYEAHPRGLTQLHPQVPEALRGTFAGLASEPILEHLTELGVTAIELLPVHLHLDEPFLAQRGLTNYWGYSTIGFFRTGAALSGDQTESGDFGQWFAGSMRRASR